jgi:hypothetical protein
MIQKICDSEFPWCPADAKAGDFYKLRLKDLSPTQFAVGNAEIQVRAGRMRKKYKKDPAKLHDYLRTRPIPILVRGNKFYLVDHHHLASGLYLGLNETLGDELCVYVKVLGNGSRPLRRRSESRSGVRTAPSQFDVTLFRPPREGCRNQVATMAAMMT